jgi:hypothetical protein
MIDSILQWLRSPEFLVSLWGALGGFVASEFKRREAKLLPPTTQIHLSRGERISDHIWNIALGWLLVYLYVNTGSKLNILSATITGGSAPLILKNLLAAAPHQLPGTTEPAPTPPPPLA